MIETRSVFWYGFEVDDNHKAFIIDEGSGNLQINLNNGLYSFTEFAQEVSRALTEQATNSYTVTANRDRTITVSSTSSFSLLPSQIGVGLSVFPIMGFTQDVTGTSLISDSKSGKEYKPQLYLQSYSPFEDNKAIIDKSISYAMNGGREVLLFGQYREMMCNIRYITNAELRDSGVLHNNQQAVEQIRDFLSYCITGSKIEFIPNENAPSTFYKCYLNKTTKGEFAFTLKEMKIKNFYETGKLTFREAL